MDIKFDYNDYWADTPEEPKYVEESYDEPTDQDFWELHKFVLESEIELCDPIYSESVGSAVKNVAGAVIDKILEAFIRIAEAFKKQSMKKAIKWLNMYHGTIQTFATDDETIRKSLLNIWAGYTCIAAYAKAFNKWANKPNMNDVSPEKLGEELLNIYNSSANERLSVKVKMKPTEEAWKRWDTSSISKLIDDVAVSLYDGTFDQWYKFAQNLRVNVKKVDRQGKLYKDEDELDRVTKSTLVKIPTEMLKSFDMITEGIKAIQKRYNEMYKEIKARDKAKKPIVAPTAESYDLFESDHIEESYEEPTDQDFWELHKFVLECELDIYGGIYSESVGSIVKASFGIILDKIVNAFLRICEAFKKKSMKRAIKWFKENDKLINEKGKDDKEILDALARIKHGHRVIAVFASLFKEWAKIDEGKLTNEKIARQLIELSKEVDNRLEKTVATPLPRLVDAVVIGLESAGYEDWYKFAQDLRSKTKLLYRVAQADGNTDVADLAQKCLELPKKLLDAFNDITEGIKTIHSRVSAKSKAEAKKKNQTPKPATESYYVEFEPEVDIIF